MSDCGWTTRPQSFTSTAWGELDLKTLYTQRVSYGSGASSGELLSMQSSAEWKLNPQVFICILQAMGPCQIDLFATRLNHQFNCYVSWRPDPFAMATDAFEMPWKDQQGYAFPPFALVGKCPEDSSGEEHGGLGHPSVGDSAMVSLASAASDPLPIVVASSLRPSERSIREEASSSAPASVAVSRLESLRDQHLAAGFSE